MHRMGSCRGWILPVASSVPLAAIAMALILGPSPRKYLAELPAMSWPVPHTQVPGKALDALRRGPAGTERVLAESLTTGTPALSPGLRAAAVRLLAERGYRPGARVLEGLLENPGESPALKAQALRALNQLDRHRGARWATRALGQPGMLGEEAKAWVDPSAQLGVSTAFP